MLPPILKKAGDLPSIAASALSTMNIPVQNNHHGLHLNCLDGGVALTQGQIETDIDSVTIQLTTAKGVVTIVDRLTPAEIFDLMNDYPNLAKDNTYVNAGDLYIPFTRPGRLRIPNMTLALGMADVQVYHLEVRLTAGLTNLDQIEVIPEVDLDAIRPLGEHCEWRLETRAFGAIAREQYLDAPKAPEIGIALLATHIGLGTAPGVIDDIEVSGDGITIYDRISPAVNNFILHQRALTPNVDYWHVEFARNFIPLAASQFKSIVYRINWSTAPVAYRMVHEIIAGVGNANA